MKQTKIAFYHFKGEKRTHVYVTRDSIEQIKGDMIGNGAVLEAVVIKDRCTIYTRNSWNNKGDYLDNSIGLEDSIGLNY